MVVRFYRKTLSHLHREALKNRKTRQNPKRLSETNPNQHRPRRTNSTNRKRSLKNNRVSRCLTMHEWPQLRGAPSNCVPPGEVDDPIVQGALRAVGVDVTRLCQ